MKPIEDVDLNQLSTLCSIISKLGEDTIDFQGKEGEEIINEFANLMEYLNKKGINLPKEATDFYNDLFADEAEAVAKEEVDGKMGQENGKETATSSPEPPVSDKQSSPTENKSGSEEVPSVSSPPISDTSTNKRSTKSSRRGRPKKDSVVASEGEELKKPDEPIKEADKKDQLKSDKDIAKTLLFNENGTEKPIDISGGGPIDVALFALRAANWSLQKNAHIIDFVDDVHRAIHKLKETLKPIT